MQIPIVVAHELGHNPIRFDDLISGSWSQFSIHRDDPLELWAYNNQHHELETLVED